MRTAIISDIHGNYQALLAVLKDAEICHCQRIVCLGDAVEGFDEDELVVRYLYNHQILTVLGNHDETQLQVNDVKLSPEMLAYVSQLPEFIIEQDILYTHISPRRKKSSINLGCVAFDKLRQRFF